MYNAKLTICQNEITFSGIIPIVKELRKMKKHRASKIQNFKSQRLLKN